MYSARWDWGCRISALFALGLVIPACGGGGGGGSTPTSATWSFNPQAIELLAQPSHKDDSLITFPSGDPIIDGLIPGAIIFSRNGEGFLREVLGVDFLGGQTLIRTKDAPLTALLTDLKATHSYAPDEILLQDAGPSAEVAESGIVSAKGAVPAGVSAKVYTSQTGFDLKFPLALGYSAGYELVEPETSTSVGSSADIEITGSASVSFVTYAAADITQAKVQMFRWQQTFTAAIDAKLRCSKQVYKKWKLPLKDFKSVPFPIGPIPCSLSVTPYFVVDASLQGEIDFSGWITRTVGFEWTEAGGWRAINSGTQTLTGTSTIKGSVRGAFGVDVFLKMFSAVGPFIGVEVGADALVTVNTAANSITLQIDGFIAPKVGGRVEIIIASILIYEKELYIPIPAWRFPIWINTWSPPSAPANVVASPQTSSILLTWQDMSPNESGFRVKRRVIGDIAWVTLATLSKDTTFYTDSSATPGIGYVFVVVAFNAQGDADSNTATAGILSSQNDMALGRDGSDTLASPSLISVGSGTGALEGQDIFDVYGLTLLAGSTLTVTAQPAGSLDVGLILYDPDLAQHAASNATGSVSENILDFPIDKSGIWRVVLRRFNGSGAYTLQLGMSSGLAGPSAPTLLAPSDGMSGLSTVDLDWSDSTGSGPITYWLQIATDANFQNLLVSTNTLTLSQFQVVSLPPGTLCYWRVRALNPTQQSDWSATWRFTTAASIPGSHLVQAPAVPSGPTSVVLGTSAAFSTTGTQCNQGHSVSYRFGWGDAISVFSGGTQSHQWSSAGTYTVQAQIQCTQGALSDWSPGITVFVTDTSAALPDLVVESLSVSPGSGFPGSSIIVSFTVRNIGAASPTLGYADARVRLSQGAVPTPSNSWLLGTRGGLGTIAATAGLAQSFSETVTIPSGLAAGSYLIGVTANESGGLPESDVSNNQQTWGFTVSSGTPPPTDLAVTPISTTSIFVTWVNHAFSDQGVTGVVVERADGSPTTFNPLTTLPPDAASYEDTTASSAITYYYRVGAVTTSSTSYSQTASATQTATSPWTLTSAAGAPSARYDLTAVWTGSRVFLWGGLPAPARYDGALYDPSTDSWSTPSTAGAPDSPDGHTTVWTGTKAIVWGGGYQNTGAIYDPSTNTWSPTSTTGAPEVRSRHVGVWTGSHMVVWGGEGSPGLINTGGVYDPSPNTWASTTLTNAPSARWGHTGVWANNRVIIWGGSGGSLLNDGRVYDPGTDSWTIISTTGAPSPRRHHSAIWTGTRMLIWGGAGSGGVLNDGASYDPSTDTWTSISPVNTPSPRSYHGAVWSGTKMLVWGGEWATSGGGIYDPATDTWTSMSANGEPTPQWRTRHVAVWTGNRLFVWGGQDGGGQTLGNGGLFAPN